MVVAGRKALLKPDGGVLSNVIKNSWLSLPTRFPGLQIDEFIVMPDHFHGILIVPDELHGSFSVTAVMRAFKSISAIQGNAALGRHGQFWQRSFHDRVIRNEKELDVVRTYIRNNPVACRDSGSCT